MTRLGQRGIGWAGVAALGLLLGGCQDVDFRSKEHASSTLLDSGPQPNLSKQQAADVHVALGRSHERQGLPEQARASYLEALKRDPKRADAEARLAILEDLKGDQASADRHFERALKLAPKDAEILCDRGYCLYLRRRWADAEASLKSALAADPSLARAHANLALVLARQGDDPGALAEFARAGIDPSDARTNLALVMATEGRLEDSKREYALALAAKPGSARAREGLKATTVALAGQANFRAIAANDLPTLPVDPALVRTSATAVVPPDGGVSSRPGPSTPR
jgi:Tfp pilus assembly protein PilF